jgi:hypothetical protein
MNLFSSVPENFFSILASKNKDIYALALDVLYQSLQSDEMTIRKDDYIRTLRDSAAEFVLRFDYEGEDDDVDTFVSASLPSKAAFICRRLEETGWIDIEIDPETFEEQIALPSYAIQFLTLIHEIVSDSESQYTSLVHATYSELKLEDEERDEFMYATLLRVYENTRKLRTELVTLGHSIRIYQHRLGQVFSTNKVLSDYFDDYKSRVSDRLYHPLKTFDSVAKFKRHITNILQHWLRDDDIRKQLVQQSLIYSRQKDRREAEADVIEKINYITDMYEQLNRMVDEIDVKHSEYTKASATKILYLNNTDKTIKGHLETIFKHYGEAALTGEGVSAILNGMANSISLFEAGYINPDSLTLPIVRRYREEGEPLPIVDFEDVSRMLMQGFLDETRNHFSDARIASFMKMAFGDKDQLHIGDIPLPDYDAFILLILATVHKDDRQSFYDIQTSGGKLVSGPYLLPDITFIRRGTPS